MVDGALLTTRVAELKPNAPLKLGRNGETSERCLNSPPKMKECLPCTQVRLSADRKSTRLNSSHLVISYAVFCLKKKKNVEHQSVSVLQCLHTFVSSLIHSVALLPLLVFYGSTLLHGVANVLTLRSRRPCLTSYD